MICFSDQLYNVIFNQTIYGNAMARAVTQTMALDELKDYFECPVCLSVPRRPPIWQCDKGHMICGTCRPKVVNCPTCRGRFSQEQRLYFAERLLEKVPVACKYSEEGCEVELVPGQMARHEAECDHRHVGCVHMDWGCRVTCAKGQMAKHVATCQYKPEACLMADCKQKVPKKFLIRHMAVQHKFVRQEGIMDLGTINYVLLLILVVSLAMNLSSLYS